MYSRKFSISTLCFISLFASQFALAQVKPNTAHTTPSQHSAKKSSVDGVWLGTLHTGTQVLHGRLEIRSDNADQLQCTLYSLDQGPQPLPCTNVKLNGRSFSFDVPSVQGHWTGHLSANKKTLSGTWNQGTPHPLDWSRQVGAPLK